MSTPPPKSPHSPSIALSWKRERDELLAALKALVTHCEKAEFGAPPFRSSDHMPDELRVARALIARIEKP